MDNLTHGLFGVAMARAGLGKHAPWAAPLLAVAANAPDIESFIPSGSTAAYLLYHRGISHSVLGIVIEAALLMIATLGILKWRKSPERPHPGHVFVVAFLGAASHLLLDWLNTYGVRPWLPFSERVYYGDITFIIDPWFWLLLWGGCFLTAPDTRASRWIYGVMGVVMAVILLWATSMGLPLAVVGIWLALAAGVVLWRTRRVKRVLLAETGRFGRATLAAVAFYLLTLGVCSESCRALAVAHAGGTALLGNAVISSHPTPAIPWRYTVLIDRGERVESYAADLLRGTVTAGTVFETRRDEPALFALQNSIEVRAWLFFARHRIAWREGDTLVLGDARYRLWNRPDWTEMRLKVK